ncbi:cupin domain-containing protein [Nitratireductor mangrovi]|uniref:Cupin domain-containing protein n=1 Tax=Nitratireductor mangrovi TaxID=2599600 RepID=A0A5B8KV43_9HYPH|nr:cupin domain-containing protein [Nitratireductor mangrovi]QDY99431.2 cupin domain-containing protein [Nitratireductor mangrovi]
MTIRETVPAAPVFAPVAQPRQFLSFTARIMGNGTDTGGLHAVELHLPPGESSPWHVHHEEDEWFHVIDGEIEAIVGDTRFRVGSGGFAFGPRHVPHGFRVTSATPTRLVLITVGGRFSDFIAENSVPIADGATLEVATPDLKKLAASASRYGQEVFGPLPD